MPKKYKPKISKEYLLTQVALHNAPKGYGGGGDKWADFVLRACDEYDLGIPPTAGVLDYGAGRGTLGEALRLGGVLCLDYDPAFPGMKGSVPELRDVVVCTDVLEHVEEDKVDEVLDDIRANTRRVAVLVIALTPANKVLPDGRNAHITLKPAAWWTGKLESRFDWLTPIRAVTLGTTTPIRPEKEIGFLCHVADKY
jgi:hypothetical protein